MSPIDAVIVEKEDTGELAGGVEVGPVDGGAAAGAGGWEDVGAERGVKVGEEAEVRRLLRVPIPGVDRRRIDPSPLLALHRRLPNRKRNPS